MGKIMIYLDNAATTGPSVAALEAFKRSLDIFGNPSSLHEAGLAAEREVSAARKAIAGIIGAEPNEIYFTSGGTESNNLAIFGGAKKHKGRLIITAKAEHPSISEPLARLASRGDFELSYDINDASKACLITLSHVNGESGAIADIEAIGKTIKRHNPNALFHVDAAQSFCKIPINVRTSGIDLMTVSAHKIGGLKGCGALFVRDGVKLNPLILGGGQEAGLRSGTENVAGIMALAAAALDFHKDSAAHAAHAAALKERFLKIANMVKGIKAAEEPTSPYILSFSIEGVKAHVLLNALSAEGVYISVGAACSTKKRPPRANDTLRVSFGPKNTIEEIDQALELFKKCIEKYYW
jgi:cysteine desulfurase